MRSMADRPAAMDTHPRPVNRMVSLLVLSLTFAITGAEMPMSLTFFQHKLSWNDARAHCLSINETLVHLDPRANRFIAEILAYPSFSGVKDHFWIGLFDSDEVDDTTNNEQYVWSDTCEALGAWNAWDGSPSTGNLCVKMDKNENIWKTEKCTTSNSFMCAKPLDGCTFSNVRFFMTCNVVSSELSPEFDAVSNGTPECESICHNNSVSGPPCEFYNISQINSNTICKTYYFEPSVAPLCDEDPNSIIGNNRRRLCYEFSVNTSSLPPGILSSATPDACLYEPTTESGTEPTTALTTVPTTEPATEPATEPFSESTIEPTTDPTTDTTTDTDTEPTTDTNTDTTPETLNETTTETMNGTTFETMYETVNETTNETSGVSSETTGLTTLPSSTQSGTHSTSSPTTTPRPRDGTGQPSATTHQTPTASTTVSTTQTPPGTTGNGTQTSPATTGNGTQTPPATTGNGTQTPLATTGNGTQTPPATTGNGTQTSPATTGNGTQTPATTTGNGTQTSPATTGNGTQTPPATTGNGTQTPATITGNGTQTPPATTGNGTQTPATTTGNGTQTPATTTGNGTQTPATTTGNGTQTPAATTGNGTQTPPATTRNVSLEVTTPPLEIATTSYTEVVNISWPKFRACACVMNTPSDANGTVDKALQASSAIEKELKLDASSLSSRRRLKESAPDKRPSSAQIGIISVIVMGVIFGVIILWDFFDIYRILRYGIHGAQRQ